MAYTPGNDRYGGGQSASSPARNAAAVTPSNTVDLSLYAKALFVGVAGDITLVPAGDSSASGTGILFSNVPVGWFPVQVRRVNSTGTTATNIVAVYD